MTRGREEGGWTLVELMIAMTLMLVVLIATLGTLDRFTQNESAVQRQNDAQEESRQGVDLLARRLRNLASPRGPDALTQTPTVDRATPTDLVFRTVSQVGPNAGANTGNVVRVRYCQGTSAPTVLFFQAQSWTTADPPAMPSVASCPDATGWNSVASLAAAQYLRNSSTAPVRPIFTYAMSVGPNLTTVPTADLDSIVAVRPSLYVDANPTQPPAEVETETSVFLRNVNQPPVASFTTGVSGQSVVLNAGVSSDFEQQKLAYKWTDGGVDIGQGVVLTTLPLSKGTHSITLTVTDPGSLTDSTTRTVVIP